MNKTRNGVNTVKGIINYVNKITSYPFPWKGKSKLYCNSCICFLWTKKTFNFFAGKAERNRYPYCLDKLMTALKIFIYFVLQALGNHEFDNHVAGIIPFIRNVTFPVISANINASQEPKMEPLLAPSTVLDVGGEKVGIIGYTTKSTPVLSYTGMFTVVKSIISVTSFVSIGYKGIGGGGHYSMIQCGALQRRTLPHLPQTQSIVD